jgi:ABC-type sugar transport system permease subunit
MPLAIATLLPNNFKRSHLMRTLLLWAIGVPLPIIALYWVFG